MQGSNYTKAMEAIASVPSDLALLLHNIKALFLQVVAAGVLDHWPSKF